MPSGFVGSAAGRQIPNDLVQGIVSLAFSEDDLEGVAIAADRQQQPQRDFNLASLITRDLPLRVSTESPTKSHLRQPQLLAEFSQVGGEILRSQHALAHEFLEPFALGNVLPSSIEPHDTTLCLIPHGPAITPQPAYLSLLRNDTKLAGIGLPGQ